MCGGACEFEFYGCGDGDVCVGIVQGDVVIVGSEGESYRMWRRRGGEGVRR